MITLFVYNSRFAQWILCVIYPFVYLGAYALANHYRIGFLTGAIFIGLWIVFGLLLRKIQYALICNGLALVVALPLVYYLLVVHDTTNNFDFFPYVDIVFIIIAFVVEMAVMAIRNAVVSKLW